MEFPRILIQLLHKSIFAKLSVSLWNSKTKILREKNSRKWNLLGCSGSSQVDSGPRMVCEGKGWLKVNSGCLAMKSTVSGSYHLLLLTQLVTSGHVKPWITHCVSNKEAEWRRLRWGIPSKTGWRFRAVKTISLDWRVFTWRSGQLSKDNPIWTL